MKNFIIFLILQISLQAYSQITLDFQIPVWYLNTIHLTNSETKYLENNQIMLWGQKQFNLYNLDGTLFKTIHLPAGPNNDTSSVYYYGYITRTLFDNDASNIEYIVEYYWDSIYSSGYYKHNVRVIREDGSIIFDEPNAAFQDISSTEEGIKLKLYYLYGNGVPIDTKVFNLPGELPGSINDQFNSLPDSPVLFPNPNNGSFYLKINSSPGTIGFLELYSSTGKLLNTYKSNENIIHIENQLLPNGLYLINAKLNKSNSTIKFLINK